MITTTKKNYKSLIYLLLLPTLKSVDLCQVFTLFHHFSLFIFISSCSFSEDTRCDQKLR